MVLCICELNASSKKTFEEIIQDRPHKVPFMISFNSNDTRGLIFEEREI